MAAATLDYLATLTEERFLDMYQALAHQGFGPLDGEVAKQLKFRPQAIRKLPMELRAKKAMRHMLNTKNAELCYEVLGSYLMKEHQKLVTDFLDAVGLEHEDGMLTGDAHTPEASKVDAAIEGLAKEHAEQDVTMYIALSAQTWPELERFDELWRQRAGLTPA